MKKYIRDDGKIRNCPSNTAKMNVFEYIWFKKFFVGDMLVISEDCFGALLEGIKGLGGILFNLIVLLFFPIMMPVIAWVRIKNDKRFVERNK